MVHYQSNRLRADLGRYLFDTQIIFPRGKVRINPGMAHIGSDN
jgi:hypothetical protein